MAGGYFLLLLIRPRSLGFGDVKLALALGAAFGWTPLVVGAMAVQVRRRLRTRTAHVPQGVPNVGRSLEALPRERDSARRRTGGRQTLLHRLPHQLPRQLLDPLLRRLPHQLPACSAEPHVAAGQPQWVSLYCRRHLFLREPEEEEVVHPRGAGPRGPGPDSPAGSSPWRSAVPGGPPGPPEGPPPSARWALRPPAPRDRLPPTGP
ncbi:A24 family peptidase [Streptomyces sp. SBC-4]|nr:A24 family peptidase [Streptomyces sp. SBC-4]MDV5143267.1 A24 family peptidase [Streptomyces sp. SBC-4]